MDKIIMTALLLGGLTMIFSGSYTASSLPIDRQSAVSLAKINLISVASSPVDKKEIFHFYNVNGISLNDDVEAVIDKLGQPLSKEKDAFFAEMEVYVYPEINIGFSDGMVSYVEVLAAAGTASIDGVSVPIGQAEMIAALGEPDFVAEDGLVFQRNTAYIKLFTDMETHEVTGIHYYSHSTI
jgi:hypothetical protein